MDGDVGFQVLKVVVLSRGRVPQIMGYGLMALFVTVFCLLPLGYIVLPALEDPAVLLGLLKERPLRILSFTMVQAIISTLATILFAFPAAHILARKRFPGRSLLLSLTTVPFILPPLVIAVGFIALFGTNGHINRALSFATGGEFTLSILYSPFIIVIAHIFLNFPVALRILHARLSTLDQSLMMASQVLNASRARTFFRVVLPQMRYSLTSAASIIFTYCFLSFGVILVIGGMTNATVEVEMYRQFYGSMDRGLVASYLLIQTVIVLAATSVYLRTSGMDGKTGMSKARKPGPSPVRSGPLTKAISVLYMIVMFSIVLGPLIAVLFSSFDLGGPGGFSTDNYISVLGREGDPSIIASPLRSMVNSLSFAILASAATVPVSVLAAYLIDSEHFRGKPIMDVVILFPIGASAVALGYGLASSLPSSSLSGTWAIIVLVHVLLAYPFCTRSVLAAKREVDASLIRAATTLGASRGRVFFDVELPAMMPGIAVGAVFAFAISLGEFGATYMVFSPEYSTMPIALYGFLSGQDRGIGPAAAYAMFLISISAISFFFLDRITKGRSAWS